MVKKLNHMNPDFYYQQLSLLTITTSLLLFHHLHQQPPQAMDIAPTSTATANNNNNTNPPKSPDPETETSPQQTATRMQPAKPSSVTNGILKRHHPHHHHLAPPVVINYKECLKNHAATMGGHALDGCGEFLPSPTATASDPTSLKCAACGCHRNFHRREPEHSPPHATTTTTTIEYQPHHRHHPPPPPTAAQANRSPNSASPPPISSSYYPSAPHMLLALSGGVGGMNENAMIGDLGGNSTRKRFRTKFSQDQKERMYQFAERVGWKMQKKDEELVRNFCNEVGVDKGVLKVWMHNNKNTFGKRSEGNGNVRIASNDSNGNDNDHNVLGGGDNTNANGNNNGDNHHQRLENDNVGHMGTNGSSSSS